MSDLTTENKPGSRRTRVILGILPLLLFAILAAVFFRQLTGGQSSSTIPSALLGKSVPQFDLPALDGLKENGVQIPGMKTADFAGKVTVVNVWASWCVPCRAEHPMIMELGQDTRFRVFGINYKDKPENALRFLGQLGNPYDAVGTDQKGRTTIDWGVYGIPETFVVGRDGKIRYKFVGPLGGKSFQKMKDEIEKALKS